MRSDLQAAPLWEPPSCWWPPNYNQPGINNGGVPNQANASPACQSPNISSSSVLKRNFSSLSEKDRYQKKRETDQKYREKLKVRIPSLSSHSLPICLGEKGLNFVNFSFSFLFLILKIEYQPGELVTFYYLNCYSSCKRFKV